LKKQCNFNVILNYNYNEINKYNIVINPDKEEIYEEENENKIYHIAPFSVAYKIHLIK
jgi:hypothetical protein